MTRTQYGPCYQTLHAARLRKTYAYSLHSVTRTACAANCRRSMNGTRRTGKWLRRATAVNMRVTASLKFASEAHADHERISSLKKTSIYRRRRLLFLQSLRCSCSYVSSASAAWWAWSRGNNCFSSQRWRSSRNNRDYKQPNKKTKGRPIANSWKSSSSKFRKRAKKLAK